MFQGMFDTPEQILTGVKQGAVLSSWQRLPKNCADLMPMPQKQRKKNYPIGLKNQGATCYLNSFLQILYHTPQLRKMILDLPLCKENIQTKSDFVNHAKHNFLLGFQRLFSQMSMKDAYAVQTDYLNKAFGWQGKQHVEQQDMTQAMKIIFDTMQRALYDTQYQKSMKNLFKGINARYKTCRNCTISEQRQQAFYDLNVQVKNFKSLSDSLLSILTPQSMQEDNKIYCQTCQSKQDMWLGTRFKTFPNILVFTLNRFQFDYQTFNRVKLNSYFQFNLQQNLTHLIDQGKQQEFQLYGVIIHRGSAHSGHYLAYIRDIVHQSDWENSITLTYKQNQKNQLQKTPFEKLTQQQQKKRLQLEKQDKVHQLKQPENKNLLQNWYELNDSIVTAIDAKKITSKYQGSDSAYILFYRRKNIMANAFQMKIPQYFQTKINEQNKKCQQQRQKYQYQKNHIILKINQNDQKLNIKTSINELLNQFCPQCFSLVMQATHNNLPYYPMQFNPLQKQFTQQDTIQKYQIYHQSKWKTYLITDDQYIEIKDKIGKQKLPFQVNVLYQGKNKKIILYQDQILNDIRKKLQQQWNIPYQNQIIQLVTPYKECFVTDQLANDQALLTKLGFIHQCQIIVKKLAHKKINNENQGSGQGQQQQQLQKKQKDQLCFVIERDDQIGIKKIYFSKYQTLQDLLKFIILSQKFNPDQKRRLRNLNGNRLYYIDHYSKQLYSFNFNEEMIKLRIQRGQIPIKGDICVKAKLQSKFQQAPQNTIIQKVFDPNTSITDLKNDICNQAKLDSSKHRIYLTDWMGEPVRSITKQTQSIFEAHFSRQETICLRDTQSPIGSQLLHFEIFTSQTGSADNLSKDSFHAKTQIHKTILQFKQMLLQQQIFKQKRNLKPKQLRIRQIKRDYMFGNIWRNHDKQMKDVQTNTNKLVIQLLEQEQDLKQDQIVVLLKKRNIQKKIYEGNTQLIFNAGKQPKIQEFQKAIKQKLQLIQDLPLMVIKYFNYNFQWLQISAKTLQKMSSKKKNQPNKQKKQKNKNQPNQQNNKQNPKTKNNQTKIQDKVNENNIISQISTQKNEKTEKRQQNKQIKHNKNKNKQQKPKKQKKNDNKNQNQQKSNKQQNNQKKSLDYLNLRKAPMLLKDGDWIGWANSEQIKNFKDDLQTQQDLSLQFIKKSNKTPINYKRNQGNGFKINVGF